MKTLLLTSSLLLTSFFTRAQTTAIPDVNFEQALINLGFDNTLDGIVLTSNISTIDSLNVNSSNISDLTGIEDFTALSALFCEGNQISSLDVTQNTTLIYLYCNHNQLTSLDITQNISLNILHCFYNQLTSIDLTQNSALIYLDCNHNQLTNLDITQNTALANLRFIDNQLTTLDATQNSALINLECENNQLSSIDITQNIALKYLYCMNNQLTSLDVTQNSALTTLRCVNNQLANLDLTQNTVLGVLRCDDNQLSCLNLKNGSSSLFWIIADNNPNLTCIEVDNVSLSNNWTVTLDPQTSFSTNCNNSCSTVGIEEKLITSTTIYPNPTSKTINIDLGESLINPTITLTNSLGQVVLNKRFDTTDLIHLDIDAPKGIYFLQLRTEEGSVITKKIIKE